jgi:hypothetical protein
MAKKKKKVAKKTIVKGKPKAQTKAAKPKAKNKDMTRWENIQPKVILAVADICDGHTIMKPKAFLELGLHKDMVKAHTHVIKSDFSDHKSTIFGPDGKPVESMEGVYGLDVLADIVRQLKLNYHDFLGRGFQAREWQRVIAERFNPTKQKA